MADGPLSVLVLGIGNLLWADEGFGVRAVEAFHRLYEFPPNVRVMDGGTQGIYLVQHIRKADILIVFDAVDYGLPPGTIKIVEGDEVPQFLGIKKISLHQTGFQEVLAMAQMLGDYPSHLLLIGVQPEELEDYGGSLRPVVRKKILPATETVIAYLEKHGVPVHRRCDALSETDTIASGEITLSNYENGRPGAHSAFRHGDDRVVSSDRWQGPKDFELEVERLVYGERK
ncbi:HyaD/HybD family hydrogenase maturation endopeptidase [Hoeflea sp. TYP-13]|uniref:HyaD/HybD family hydrogenase maturation endopeptidase n=1 Tax=Hoeflea sp. TYP-13 TaxID=3230023 RepID=UPI0034C624FD